MHAQMHLSYSSAFCCQPATLLSSSATYGAAVLPVGNRVVEWANGMKPEDLTTQR